MENMRMKSITFFRVVLTLRLIAVCSGIMPYLSAIIELLNMRVEIFSELGYVYSFLIHGIAFPDGYGVVLS